MELHVYLTFVIATAIMIALPGPSVLLTVAHSISFGWQSAISTVAGATMGVAVQLIIAVIGLTSLLNLVAEAFEWFRWAGAAYLIYLGVKQWQNASHPVTVEALSISRKSLFIQGLIITIPNPKSLIFIAAFLPQFIDTSRALEMQFAIIIPTFLIITFCVTSIWALATGKIRLFLHNQRIFRAVFRTAGGLMVSAGIGLALARRN